MTHTSTAIIPHPQTGELVKVTTTVKIEPVK
jgi:hypothetical protein